MEACTYCQEEVETLFAPFDEGEEMYCSDCQMEAESEAMG